MKALAGRNPYQEELDEVREAYGKTAADVASLRVEYTNTQEHANAARHIIAEYEKLLAKSEKQLSSYQALIELLRERIREYQERIEAYNAEIDKAKNG